MVSHTVRLVTPDPTKSHINLVTSTTSTTSKSRSNIKTIDLHSIDMLAKRTSTNPIVITPGTYSYYNRTANTDMAIPHPGHSMPKSKTASPRSLPMSIPMPHNSTYPKTTHLSRSIRMTKYNMTLWMELPI